MTRRRYIHAQVLKHNTDDLYEGRLTLRRKNGGLEDVSERLRVSRARARGDKAAALAQAVGRQWHLDQPMQKSGVHGVFECRDRLGKPWSEMSKNELRSLVGASLDSGLLTTAPHHPAHPRAKQANWLVETQDTGGEKLVDELLMQAVRGAWKTGRPFTRGGEDGLAARKGELPYQLQAMQDDHLEDRVMLAAATGKFDVVLHTEE